MSFSKTNLQDYNFTPDFNRFYLILDGEGMLELEGQRYYPKAGELYLLPADVKQLYSTISDPHF